MYMKLLLKPLSKALFVLSILFLQINFVSAFCKGQPVTLAWSASNNPTACPTHSSPVQECRFDEAATSFNGSKTITAPTGGCTVQFQCSNTAGNSNLGSATLSVDDNFYWDPNATNQTTGVPDGACVAATWTDYCPSMADPNISLSTVRDKVWQQTTYPSSDWPPKSPSAACCSETGVMGACPTGNITVTPCEIAANSNTCTATISWTSTGATDPRLFT